MTDFASSLFTSASDRLARRMEAMRSAEEQLLSYAKRFRESGVDDQSHTDVEVLDTKIPRSAVPLRHEDTPWRHNGTPGCQLFPTPFGDDDDDETASDLYLTMHGIRVINRKAVADARDDGGPPPLVLLHGYANGALYFYRNLLGLSQAHYPTVYALDMLGWGLSSRPKFPTTTTTTTQHDHDHDTDSAESFFVESLEAWRREHNIETMTLGGHSMGGYLSVAYAEKYPERVERLILMSPVGVPHQVDDPKMREKMPLRLRLMYGLASRLWNNGTTLGSFLRSMPESRARALVQEYVNNRMPGIECPEERSVIAEYLFTNAMLPGSGEYCLKRILNPMLHAKKPAVYRIPQLKVKSVHFVYGEHDFMDVNGGLEAQKLCAEMRREGMIAPEVEVHGVKGAGHLLMFENWEEFNSAVIIAGGGEHKLKPDAPRPNRFGHMDSAVASTFFKNPFGKRNDHQDARQEPSGVVPPKYVLVPQAS